MLKKFREILHKTRSVVLRKGEVRPKSIHISIKRQRFLFHIEMDLDMAKRLIRYMFFQN